MIPPPPTGETGAPVAGPASIFAGPQSFAAPQTAEGDDEDLELTEAEATIVPDATEMADPAEHEPAVDAEPLYPQAIAATAAALPPAGWYPDPHNTLYRRWWDGTAWTNAVEPLLRNAQRFQVSGNVAANSEQDKAVRDSLRGLKDDLGRS